MKKCYLISLPKPLESLSAENYTLLQLWCPKIRGCVCAAHGKQEVFHLTLPSAFFFCLNNMC